MPGLLTKPIDAIEFQDVRDYCALRRRENLRLDYKEDFSSKHPGKQIAKEVAAFANTHCGMILWCLG